MPIYLNKAFNVAMDDFNAMEIQILRAKFSDPLLQAFLRAQAEQAKKQFEGLNPDNTPVEKAAEFLQAAKDARRIHEFWDAFDTFVRDWAHAKNDNTGE